MEASNVGKRSRVRGPGGGGLQAVALVAFFEMRASIERDLKSRPIEAREV